MSIMAPIALLTIPGCRHHPCPLRGLGLRGIININIRPIKPFETVTVIKGYTNRIDLTLLCRVASPQSSNWCPSWCWSWCPFWASWWSPLRPTACTPDRTYLPPLALPLILTWPSSLYVTTSMSIRSPLVPPSPQPPVGNAVGNLL